MTEELYGEKQCESFRREHELPFRIRNGALSRGYRRHGGGQPPNFHRKNTPRERPHTKFDNWIDAPGVGKWRGLGCRETMQSPQARVDEREAFSYPGPT